MSFSLLLTMFGYMIVCSITPGPGNLLALNVTTVFGWDKARPLLWGICFGYALVQLFCTLLVKFLEVSLEPALTVLRYVGCAYVCLLALMVYRSRPSSGTNSTQPKFFTGLLLQLVNVKIYLYVLTLLTTYFVPLFSTSSELFFAGVATVALGSATTFLWAFLGVRMQSWHQIHYRAINAVLSLFLLYCAYGMARS